MKLGKKFPSLTEPEGSLACLQQTPIGPYSEPDESTLRHHPLFLQDTFLN